MGIVVIEDELKEADLVSAREDYEFYIKITADIEQGIVIIGGEYHADAEEVLIEKYSSLPKDIWGGGYNIKSGEFETNAIINIRSGVNKSMEILDQKIREKFLALIQDKLKNIKELL